MSACARGAGRRSVVLCWRGLFTRLFFDCSWCVSHRRRRRRPSGRGENPEASRIILVSLRQQRLEPPRRPSEGTNRKCRYRFGSPHTPTSSDQTMHCEYCSPDRGHPEAVLAIVKAWPGSHRARGARASRRPALTSAARGVFAPARVGTEKRFLGRTEKLMRSWS
jgi:hypothetical protein